MRSQVLASWHRSAAAGVAAGAAEAPVTLPGDVLRDHREAHPLALVLPLLNDVLGQAAQDCDAVMALTDASGHLLWVCGSPSTLRRAERIGFVEGSNWDERLAGTNAPGMTLALDQPVTVTRSEHFRESVRRWSCAAAPIHDPMTGALLGALDLTGGDTIAVPQTMALVRAAARMAHIELQRDRPPSPVLGDRRGGTPGVRLRVLGRTEAAIHVKGPLGPVRAARLSPRHSEVLLLLAAAPGGLSGDELTTLLYEGDASPSTLRAEMNRLRALLGDDLLPSRPYRLAGEISADWLEVEARLVAGDLEGAVNAYRGPILARSSAPGVVRLRQQLEWSLRHAIMQSADPTLMSWWTRSPWGCDDLEMWQAAERCVSTSSPLLPLIRGQLSRLDREYGLALSGGSVTRRHRPGRPPSR